MRRNRVIASVVVAALLMAFGAWWGIRPPELVRPPGPPPLAAPAGVASEPLRPPELFGTIEAVHPGVKFLVRSTRPNTPGWDSPQNEHHRKYDLKCWVLVREGLAIRRRDSGRVEVAVGQTVSAWCSGGMYTTNPPLWSADAVVIEPADR
jgi:hypothetical protein